MRTTASGLCRHCRHSWSANIQVAEYLDKIPDIKLLREQLHRSVQRAREQVALGALQPVSEPDGEEQ